MKNIFIGTLGAGAICIICVLAYKLQARDAEREELAVRLQVADARAHKAEAELRKAKEEPAHVVKRAAAPVENKPPIASATQGAHESITKSEAMRAVRTEAARARFAAFFRQLALPQDKQDKLIELFVHQKEAIDALAQAAMSNGQRVDSLTLNVISDQTAAELKSQIKETFGEDFLSEYQFYQGTLPVRGLVSDLGANLLFTNEPLGPLQAGKLMAIIADYSRNDAGKVTLDALRPERILNSASSILSAGQMAALSDALATAQRQHNANKQLENEVLKREGGR